MVCHIGDMIKMTLTFWLGFDKQNLAHLNASVCRLHVGCILSDYAERCDIKVYEQAYVRFKVLMCLNFNNQCCPKRHTF